MTDLRVAEEVETIGVGMGVGRMVVNIANLAETWVLRPAGFLMEIVLGS